MDPQIGEIRLAHEIGRVGRTKYVWVKCPACGLKRWAHSKLHLSPTLRLCKNCAADRARKSFVIRHT
jgi:hypothetical protein